MTNPNWHPFTQHGLEREELLIESGEGCMLYTKDGRALIDAISSWWVNLHGHAQPKIASAIASQAAKLEHVIFAGLTHEPAEDLSKKLMEITPESLQHVFYSDNGSTAVEVALKMAVAYWHNQGFKQKTKILALEHGYHGDTCGAMSVSSRSVFTEQFSSMMFDVTHIPFPELGAEQHSLDVLEQHLSATPNNYAAFIAEPLVLGAGGMKMYPAKVLKQMVELCRKHQTLFIADEVMTGFGRTGTMFACEQAGISPDLMCISKGITGGFLPLAAALTTKEIYSAFYSSERSKMFFHGHSYTANPIACAAGVANLKIFQEQPVLEKIARIQKQHQKRLSYFRNHPAVKRTSTLGVIAVIELEVSKQGYLSDIATTLADHYLEKNILLRPLGNVIYILPPYCITTEQLDNIYDVITDSLTLIA